MKCPWCEKRIRTKIKEFGRCEHCSGCVVKWEGHLERDGVDHPSHKPTVEEEQFIDHIPIVIGKKYHNYDDGKIRESRRDDVVLFEKIPFDKADPALVTRWSRAVESCYWLFSKTTDFFLVGEIPASTEFRAISVVYARTLFGSCWFSINDFIGSGLLVDDRENETADQRELRARSWLYTSLVV